MKLIRRNSLEKELWSGGSTTEIFIDPPEQSYHSKKFIWRLSEATIEDEKTTFTKLEGFNRISLVLEGQLKLQHENFKPIKLKTLDQSNYKGHWHTLSEGKATNLNLIYDPSITARMETINVDMPSYDYTLYNSNLPRKSIQHLVYTLTPLKVIYEQAKHYVLNKGEAILFNDFIDSATVKFLSQTNKIQFVHIQLERENTI